MDFYKGANFAVFAPAGALSSAEAQDSIRKMVDRLHTNTVILVPNGLMDTPQSTTIDYSSSATYTDEELIAMIQQCKAMGMKVMLKPTVNCRNGMWRAYISFFEEDVVCEPKWSEWFAAYTEFQVHYAKIAEQTGCDMLIAGCEMVMSEHRDREWREVIAAIRKEYGGPVSYNTDKYQEHRVTWWDAVDVIATSGYYPTDRWEAELDRIEAVSRKYGKPVFFSELGCMSTHGASVAPNNWCVRGDADTQEQAEWYRGMIEACSKRDWICGIAIWDWCHHLYPERKACEDRFYGIYAKPAEKVLAEFFMTR